MTLKMLYELWSLLSHFALSLSELGLVYGVLRPVCWKLRGLVPRVLGLAWCESGVTRTRCGFKMRLSPAIAVMSILPLVGMCFTHRSKCWV